MHTMRIVRLLFLLLTVGCAKVERTPLQTGAPPAVAVEPSATRPTEESVAKADSPAAMTTAKLPAKQPIKKPGATSPSGTQAPPLDLTELETRLK